MIFRDDIKVHFADKMGGFLSTEITVIGDELIVLSGHKGLVKVDKNEVLVKFPKGIVCVSGKNLCLEAASPSEIQVTGEITGVTRVQE